MKDSCIKFSAVGDISLGDHPLCIGFGAYSKFKAVPPIYPFEKVLAQLKKAELLFGNLECALSKENLKANDYDSSQMRGDSRHIKGLVEAGFKVLNFANNHCMQHGTEPFLETVRLLEEYNINYCGVNLENHLKGSPSIIELNGIKVAFLGYSSRPRQYFSRNPLYSEGNINSIEKDIIDVKEKVDSVIVSLHWGDEFIEKPSPEEISMGRKLIDAGAGLIIGHHPHILRGIENYKHGVIIYSLGNFVCDMVWDRRLRESLIFCCDITKQGMENIELTPVFINDNYQPEIMDEDSGRALLLNVRKLSEDLNAETLSSFNKKLFNYQKEADDAQRLYRKKSHLFFISKIYKVSPIMPFRQIMTYVKNRANEFSKKPAQN
ncbi:MAG: CapA family protein [Candidatus Mariimomonas ferrooxydans]